MEEGGEEEEEEEEEEEDEERAKEEKEVVEGWEWVGVVLVYRAMKQEKRSRP